MFIFVYDLYLESYHFHTCTTTTFISITGPTDFFVFIAWSESDLISSSSSSSYFCFSSFSVFHLLNPHLIPGRSSCFLVKVYIGVLLLDKTVFQLLCVVCVHPKQKSKLWKRLDHHLFVGYLHLFFLVKFVVDPHFSFSLDSLSFKSVQSFKKIFWGSFLFNFNYLNALSILKYTSRQESEFAYS